ncbi:hypothetical protein TI10_21735 [Photorhabdus luminescens subsp. luminescens]|uniref:Uncharacterized protein n=1 Tax=Photorhabdus luminescens TaxID=29488 RepID=A0A1G5R8C7_PHOLU|nr:hypothetical protein [Photorhabdus luminescens]KMW71224.1 hypothetical protein TI10_21735 [Photorhabdus luminescens subsp. luminescens]SCZ70108.1 hypothetical protein SAMN02982990_03407 [Photorhabdus luminescens]
MRITIRLANTTEQIALEALQLRASLMWEEDRELLLANPHMIELPMKHIEAGYVYIAEQADVILGFCVVLPLSDGNADIQNTEYRIQNTEYRIQNTEYRIQNTEYRIQL